MLSMAHHRVLSHGLLQGLARLPERQCSAIYAMPTEYSIADQKVHHSKAIKANDKHVIAIEEFYDGSYLKGKCVLITGANRGLGLQLATEAALQGATILGACQRSSPELEELSNVHVFEGMDVANTASVKTMLGKIADGKIDIIVNNAGYFTRKQETLEAMEFKEEIKKIDICAVGPLRVSSVLFKGCKVKAPGDHIAIITS